MVKVEIVEEKDPHFHNDSNSPYASPSSSRTSSSVSLDSVDSDAPDHESLLDRISALVDIVPPSTRHSISSKIAASASFLKSGGKLAGNLVWIVTTSALLVGLPLALSLEDEAKVVAQEKEMLAQQQGAQQVRRSRSDSLLRARVLTSRHDRCCPLAPCSPPPPGPLTKRASSPQASEPGPRTHTPTHPVHYAPRRHLTTHEPPVPLHAHLYFARFPCRCSLMSCTPHVHPLGTIESNKPKRIEKRNEHK